MALFGKKKTDVTAPEAAPGPDENLFGAAETGKTSKENNDVFDFDAIAKDLEASGGASPFDALLSAPATPGQFDDGSASSGGGSAFDFPDTPLSSAPNSASPSGGFSAGAPKSGDSLDDLDALFGAATPAPAPIAHAPTSPVTPPQDDAPLTLTKTPAAALPVDAPAPAPKARKPLPLLPVLGSLAVLALAGGAGYFLTQGGQEETEPTSIASIQTDQDTPPDEGQGTATAPTSAPAAAVAPTTAVPATTTQTVTRAQTTTTTQTSARVAPRPANNSQAPAPAPTASDVPPDTLAQLKNLWEQGKAAKQRGDFEAARRFWTQALQLRPGHPGFQESINKLGAPRPATPSAPAGEAAP